MNAKINKQTILVAWFDLLKIEKKGLKKNQKIYLENSTLIDLIDLHLQKLFPMQVPATKGYNITSGIDGKSNQIIITSLINRRKYDLNNWRTNIENALAEILYKKRQGIKVNKLYCQIIHPKEMEIIWNATIVVQDHKSYFPTRTKHKKKKVQIENDKAYYFPDSDN